jgi:hypothetical protein
MCLSGIKIPVILCLLVFSSANGYENMVKVSATDPMTPNDNITVVVEIENEFEIGYFETGFRLWTMGSISASFMPGAFPYPNSRFGNGDCVDDLQAISLVPDEVIISLNLSSIYGACIFSGPLEPQYLMSIALGSGEGLIFIEPNLDWWKWCLPFDPFCTIYIAPSGVGDYFAVYDHPNFVIRDCVDDWGVSESCLDDCNHFWDSPDIWMGPFIGTFTTLPGGINCIHVSYYNNGQPTTPGHDVTLYVFAQKELGGETIGFTIDTKTISSVGHMLSPAGSAGGSLPGFYAMTNTFIQLDRDWSLCAMITSDEDSWESNQVYYENNFAKHSLETLTYWPGIKNFDPSSSFLAYFSDTVKVANPLDSMAEFLVKVENLDPGWEVMPADGIVFTLDADEITEVSFFYERDNAMHGDNTTADVILYQLPDSIILDGIGKQLWVDGVAPDSLPYFEVRLVDMPDSCPWPVYEINWDTPTLDTLGYPELLQGFEIHASTDSFDLHSPDSLTLIARTNADFNLEQDDFQHYFVPPDSQVYYFTMYALDAAGHTSEPTPILTGYPYSCGDCNNDNDVNVSDAVYIINYVFVGGDPPYPLYTGDVNCDAVVNISDAVWIINYIFVGGKAPCDTDGNGLPDC